VVVALPRAAADRELGRLEARAEAAARAHRWSAARSEEDHVLRFAPALS